jgi:hypothetical protein
MYGSSWSRITISPAAIASLRSAHLKDSFVVVPVDRSQQWCNMNPVVTAQIIAQMRNNAPLISAPRITEE